MKLKNSLCCILFAIFLNYICLATEKIMAEDMLKVTNLRTEYKTNPLGINVTKPRLSWEILSSERNTMQSAYEIRCALKEENLLNSGNLLWHSKVNSDQSIHVEYGGLSLQSRQRLYWQVRVWDNHNQTSDWSEPAFWEMGFLKESDWVAKWIEAEIDENKTKSEPAQYFRKEFKLKQPIRTARLYITSHGLYESYINNRRVGDQVFTPGWTSYNKRLQYQIYDVSHFLIEGKNTIGVVLGDGWYRGYLGWEDKRNIYGDKLSVCAQLEIEYQNGEREVVITDNSWKSTNNGPVRMSDIYMGEIYDARKEMPGWANSSFDDESWGQVKEKNISKNHLIASFGPPVKKVEEIKPVEMTPKNDDSYIFDMGQNMVGWVRLKVKGNAGEKIKLRHAEVLNKDGELYTENLRSAKQTVIYICKGGGEEVFEPHFTFQGFQFVEVSGYPGTPDLGAITGIVIHSDMTPTGKFDCSDSLINQLQHNIQWGLKGNFLDVPTDCPQRDERMGWTGDAQVFAPTACFNVDAAAFYTKWLKDLALDQGADGQVNDVIPDVLEGRGGHTGWADASVIVPWTVYLNYSDKKILENQYESMKAWIGFMKKRAGNDYIWVGDWHYGDWLSFDDDHPAYMGAYTETDLIATAYFAYSTTLLSKIANILDKPDDADEFAHLAEKIKQAFLKEFVTPNGRLVSHTQTAYTLALAMDLLPDSLHYKAAENLFHNVNRFKHITTGFLGTPHICRVLTDCHYLETAYMLLNRKEYPSWLYPVTMGATTIWERWDGIKPDSTFQTPAMNSLNHYAYGAIGKWLYSTVAGIDIDEENPGYKNIIINPRPGGGLTHARAALKTMYGLVSVEWKIENDLLNLHVIIPPNATATVYLPAKNLNDVKIEGKRIFDSNEIVILQDNQPRPSVKIGSGTYIFTCIQHQKKYK